MIGEQTIHVLVYVILSSLNYSVLLALSYHSARAIFLAIARAIFLAIGFAATLYKYNILYQKAKSLVVWVGET